MATESMIAPSSAILLPTSSAEFVAMLVIWHGIAQIEHEVPIHATLCLVAQRRNALGLAMRSIERWRTLCKSCLATHPTVAQQVISRADKEGTIPLATTLHPRIHGIDQHLAQEQAMLHLGNRADKNVLATTKMARLRPGSSSSNHKVAETITTTAMLLLVVAQPRGNSRHRHLLHHKTMAMVATSSKDMVKMATSNHQHLLLVSVPI